MALDAHYTTDSTVQTSNVVTAYFTSEQLVPYGFARR